MAIKIYFKGGEGIKNPIDCFGVEIKENDILTSDFFADYKFHEQFYPSETKESINEKYKKPKFLVKKDENGVLFGEGLIPYYSDYDIDKKYPKRNYLHDFRFKFTKKVCSLSENINLYQSDCH